MTRAISNVVISTDSFASWVGITNTLADALSVNVLTAQQNTAGANTTGNAQLIGIFNANTVAIGTSLRGGTITTSANLNIISNTIFSGATINATSNVNITTTNTYVNSVVTYIVGGLANVTSNASIVNGNTYVNSAVTYVVGGLANVTSNASIVNSNTYVNSSIVYISGGLANVTSNVSLVASNVTMNAATLTIRSGTLNVDSTALFTNTVGISNNLTVQGTSHTFTGNVAFDTSTLFVDTVNDRVGIKNTTPDAVLSITGTANISGSVVMGNTLSVANLSTLASANVTGLANIASANVATLIVANTNLTGNTTVQTDVVISVISNTNIGATTVSPVNIFTFSTSTYSGAKITAKIASLSGANTQVQEMILAQNGTDVVVTVYGTVSAPATANLGSFSAALSGGNVTVKFQQVSANSSVKLFTQLIK